MIGQGFLAQHMHLTHKYGGSRTSLGASVHVRELPLNPYKDGLDSGYNFDDFKRFECLRELRFQSVLDVGSGPCQLKKWLDGVGVECTHEAFDIRSDALENCDCVKHLQLPSGSYDPVCLFGTCGLRSREDNQKDIFRNLIRECLAITSGHLVFSVIMNVNFPRVVSYSEGELTSLLEELNIKDAVCLRDIPNKEYTFIHKVNQYSALCSPDMS